MPGHSVRCDAMPVDAMPAAQPALFCVDVDALNPAGFSSIRCDAPVGRCVPETRCCWALVAPAIQATSGGSAGAAGRRPAPCLRLAPSYCIVGRGLVAGGLPGQAVRLFTSSGGAYRRWECACDDDPLVANAGGPHLGAGARPGRTSKSKLRSSAGDLRRWVVSQRLHPM
jgi:hypothetical protein